jgi:hypothetical protein
MSGATCLISFSRSDMGERLFNNNNKFNQGKIKGNQDLHPIMLVMYKITGINNGENLHTSIFNTHLHIHIAFKKEKI